MARLKLSPPWIEYGNVDGVFFCTDAEDPVRALSKPLGE